MSPRTIALTRAVSRCIDRCELTHLERAPIDLERARAQHATYEEALRDLGCEVLQLPELPELPDAVFLEDTAVVLPELAVLTRPGAPSRRPEVESTAEVLANWRPLAAVQPPGRLEGGDVLVVGRRIYVGLSSRTNEDGVRQLSEALQPYGYSVCGVELADCLHLKSAACAVADHTVLANPEWIDLAVFGDLERIEVAPEEPFAANAVRIGDAVIHPAAFPLTRQRLQVQGISVRPVEADELAKAEGGVSCCSLLLTMPG